MKRNTEAKNKLFDTFTKNIVKNETTDFVTEELCKEADVSRAMFYRLFPSKGDFIVAYVQEKVDKFIEELENSSKGNQEVILYHILRKDIQFSKVILKILYNDEYKKEAFIQFRKTIYKYLGVSKEKAAFLIYGFIGINRLLADGLEIDEEEVKRIMKFMLTSSESPKEEKQA